MRRQKRKADSIQLSFVESNPKRKSVIIKKASFSLERTSQQPEPEEPTCNTSGPSTQPTCVPTATSTLELQDDSSLQHDTAHTLRKCKAAEAWNEIRPNLVPTLIEVSGFPSQPTLCLFCKSLDATVWCKDCGASAFLCEECTIRLHSTMNMFHNPVVWKDDVKMYFPFPRKVAIRCQCLCDSAYCRELTCVDEKGCYHSVSVTFCPCEPEVKTLMRAHLFPATPKQPKLVFTFTLLDWFQSLMLECQVSAEDFVAAVGVMTDSQILKDKRRSLYPVIIDSFEEYRHMKHGYSHLKLLIPDRLNDGTRCPACPKDGKAFYSIDGNFGLCRKRASGSSVRPPLHQQTMFYNQDSVDHYTEKYGKIQMPVSKECNQFLAGDALRSKSRYKALDETGVIGVVCRHEFPLKLFSMRHGERLSYIVYALEHIQETSQHYREVHILYDVACTLDRHLHKQGRTDLLGYFKLAIPVFHSYGHKVDCQFKYSPRNLDGFGLTDGECVERLWSYLRRFCKMTKEMRPSHRVDILTDALLHYLQKSLKRLDSLLSSRMRKSVKTQQDAKHELEELMRNSPVQFSPVDIGQWYQEELKPRSQSSRSQDDEMSWETQYFALLTTYYNTLDEVKTCTTSHLQAITRRLNRIDDELKVIEDQQHIQRWCRHSDVFCDWEKLEVEKERNKVIASIETSARERWFLLNLKAKFADGQCIASRLSKSLNQETAKLKRLVQVHNSLPGARQITWTDATDLSSSLSCHSTGLGVPRNIRLSAIRYQHIALRADEDIDLLKSEMRSTFNFILEDWKQLSVAINELKTTMPSRYNNGALGQLQLECMKCENLLSNLRSAFNNFVDLPVLPVNQFISKCVPLEDRGPVYDDEQDLGNKDEPSTGCLPRTFVDDDYSSSSDEDCVGISVNRLRRRVYQPHRPPQQSIIESSSPLFSDSGISVNRLRRRVYQPTSKHRPPQQSIIESSSPLFSDSEDMDDDDFFPTDADVQRRRLRLEREEFLKQQPQKPCKLSEEDKEVMSLITEGHSSPARKKGFLQRSKEELERTLEISQRATALSNVISSGPHFKSRKS